MKWPEGSLWTASWGRILASVALVCTALVAGCGGTDTSGGGGGESASTGKKLRVAFNSGLSTLDPAFACDRYEYTVIRTLYDQLVQSKPAKEGESGADVDPMLAESWKTSDGGKVTTFKLRKDVKFASGNPLTAADVEFSIRRAIDKGACANYVVTAGLPDNFESVKALDKHTVRFELKRPDPLFLESIASRASSILDSKLLKQHGGLGPRGDQWLAANGAGSGPYTLGTYRPDSEVELKPNDGYWAGEPKNGGVTVKIVTDASTLETLTKSNQADLVLGLPPKTARDLANSGTELAEDPSQFTTYIGFNNKKEPFTDARVRQALAAVIPLDPLVERFGYGFAEPFAGPIPPAMDYYPDLPIPEPDAERAKQLLAEAGKENISFTVDIENGETTHSEMATVLQDAFREIGVDMKVNTLGSGTFTDRVYNFKSESYIIDDGPTINDPGYFLGYLVRCGDAFNWTQYCNKEVDKRLEEARFNLDSERRATLYKEVSEVVVEDAPYASIWAKDHIVALPGGTTGYQYFADQVPRLWKIAPGGN